MKVDPWCAASQAFTSGVLWVEELSRINMVLPGVPARDLLEKAEEVGTRMAGRHSPGTCPSAVSSAA